MGKLKNRVVWLKKNAKNIMIIALAVAVVALFLWMSVLDKPEPETGGGSIPAGIREISQLTTLEYRYKEVITITEEEEFLLFGLVDIDPGERILIVQYDGIIKLGLDFGEIQVNIDELGSVQNGKKSFQIKLPEVKIMSSETPQDSFEVLFQKGIFTDEQIAFDTFFGEAAERQKQSDSEALNGELAEMALENAKRQIEALINSFLGPDNYEITWF